MSNVPDFINALRFADAAKESDQRRKLNQFNIDRQQDLVDSKQRRNELKNAINSAATYEDALPSIKELSSIGSQDDINFINRNDSINNNINDQQYKLAKRQLDKNFKALHFVNNGSTKSIQNERLNRVLPTLDDETRNQVISIVGNDGWSKGAFDYFSSQVADMQNLLKGNSASEENGQWVTRDWKGDIVDTKPLYQDPTKLKTEWLDLNDKKVLLQQQRDGTWKQNKTFTIGQKPTSKLDSSLQIPKSSDERLIYQLVSDKLTGIDETGNFLDADPETKQKILDISNMAVNLYKQNKSMSRAEATKKAFEKFELENRKRRDPLLIEDNQYNDKYGIR